jgi:hypothetical protein
MSLVRAAVTLAALASLAGVGVAPAQQAAPKRPPQMLHPVAGKADCLSCHGKGANEHITSVPAAHTFANGACGMCHKPIAAAPKTILHAVDDAHADCRTCHPQAAEGAPAPAPTPQGAPAAPAPPASHANFHGSTCRLCHQPAAAGAPGSGGDGDAR